MRVDRQSSLKSYTPGIIKCVNSGENIYFNKNVLQRFFSFSFLPIDYFSTWYLYLIFWHFFSKLHLKCLTLCKNRWPVKASYCMQTWHGEWCNHVGSDLFGLNRASCKGSAGYVFQFLFTWNFTVPLCPLLRQNYNLSFQHSGWRQSWTQSPACGWYMYFSCLIRLLLMTFCCQNKTLYSVF